MSKAKHISVSQEKMAELRDALVKELSDHEVTHHDGRACFSERLNAIAYLAHCIGIRAGEVHHLAACMREYDAACPCEASRQFEGQGT